MKARSALTPALSPKRGSNVRRRTKSRVAGLAGCATANGKTGRGFSRSLGERVGVSILRNEEFRALNPGTVAADVSRLKLSAAFRWSGLTSAATRFMERADVIFKRRIS